MEAVEFSLPATITIERLEDETTTTPAGEFVGCQHYRTTTASTVNIKIAKIPITEERHQRVDDVWKRAGQGRRRA